MKVFVLFVETNTGDPCGDSDGYVEAVYATKELAEEARRVECAKAIEEGVDVWWDYNALAGDEGQIGDGEWERDWRIEECEVQTTVDTTALLTAEANTEIIS